MSTGVISNVEGATDVLTVVRNLLFCYLEAVGDEVEGLHFADWEINVILCYNVGIKSFELWLVCNTVLQFSKAAHNTSSVCFQIIVFIFAHSELNCEPIDCCQSF